MISLWFFLLWAESGEILIGKLGDMNFRVREQANWTLEIRLSMMDGRESDLIELIKKNRNHKNMEIRFRTGWLYEKYYHRFYVEVKH